MSKLVEQIRNLIRARYGTKGVSVKQDKRGWITINVATEWGTPENEERTIINLLKRNGLYSRIPSTISDFDNRDMKMLSIKVVNVKKTGALGTVVKVRHYIAPQIYHTITTYWGDMLDEMKNAKKIDKKRGYIVIYGKNGVFAIVKKESPKLYKLATDYLKRR